MKIHERTFIVDAARRDINGAVLVAIEAHGLTYLEILSILNSAAATWLKYAIRDERHPDDPDGRGDEE